MLRDNRLTSVCGSSAIHGRRLLSFACPKESNQRKRHPRIRALAGRGFATGGRVRPTGHPWPVVRIGAIPRAARVRSTRLVRPPSAAAQREPESEKRKHASHICDRLLLRQGLPRSALPGFPLGRGEQAEEIAACTARGRAQDARASDLGTGMCRERTPEPARVVCRAWMPGKPRPRGCPFLWLLSFGQAKESNRRPWMVDETAHGRESVIATTPKPNQNQHHPHPTLPLKGRAKASLEGEG